MKVKTIVNSRGERQKTQIDVEMKVKGGRTGITAVEGLLKLMEGFKETETEDEVFTHLCVASGYILCCRNCSFITGENADDLIQLADYLADNERERIKAGDGRGQARG